MRCDAPRRALARRSFRSEHSRIPAAAAAPPPARGWGAKSVQESRAGDRGAPRRTDSGVTLIQRQMPVFTQQAPAYDILIAADETEGFASYLPSRTWAPVPA